MQMRTYKKILLFIAIIILIFVFAQYQKNDTNKKEVFSFWTIQLKAPLEDLIKENIKEFEKKHPDINVVWVDIPITEAQKRTIASILGGSPPDLINLNPEFSLSLAKKNTLEFFDEKDAIDYDKSLVNKLRYNGKIYALPFYATSAVTILNKEKFKNCNVDLKSYDDILKLSNCKNPPVYGAALNEGETFSKILNKYNKEEIEKTYLLFNEMKNKKLLLVDSLTVNHREVIEKYMSGSAGFITAGSNFIFMIKQNAPDIYKNSIIAPQLTGRKEEYDISLMNFIIPKKSKHKELAKEFAAQLLNEENQLKLSEKTNVLPVNKYALSNKRFTNCTSDPVDYARCTAARQLKKPLMNEFQTDNKRELTEIINKALETLFIKGKSEFEKIDIQNRVNSFLN